MKALVVYDSVFGNTEQIAQAVGQAIGQALGPEGEVAVQRVGNVSAQQLAGVELLLVGSPTRGFRPTPATVNFLKSLPANALQGVKVAAFDTGIALEDMPGFLRLMAKRFGYAARPIAKRLQKKGGTLAVPPEGFIVKASEGPLKEGELERAAAWARQLVAAR